jgi:hypothetical protein
MPKDGFQRKKRKKVLTRFPPTTYSGSVRNIIYIGGRSKSRFDKSRFVERFLLVILGAIVIAAACQGCTPQPCQPDKRFLRDPETPVLTSKTVYEQGYTTPPIGAKAVNSKTGQGKLQCKLR